MHPTTSDPTRTGTTAADTFDVVLLSFDEPLADQHHARLSEVFGPVKRLHGVRGMGRAYRLCAEIVDTEQFLIADGDFCVDPSFDPTTITPLPDDVPMRVWRTRNPVNGLVYGYGGLKQCRRTAFRQMGHAVDVLAALPGHPQFDPAVAGDTRFDASPFHTWRAGFRECAMLTRGCEYGRTSTPQTTERLRAWTTTGHGPYGTWATRGASDGVHFARTHAPDDPAWDGLNDPGWLLAEFTRLHPEAAS